jgi:hypothetical protein
MLRAGVVVTHEAMRRAVAGSMRSAGRLPVQLAVHICVGLCLVRSSRGLCSMYREYWRLEVLFARRGRASGRRSVPGALSLGRFGARRERYFVSCRRARSGEGGCRRRRWCARAWSRR